MKVWCVFDDYDNQLQAVCSTEEVAKEWIRKREPLQDYWGYNYECVKVLEDV